MKANWRLLVSCCLHIVFRRGRQPETSLTILSACFSTLLCTSLPLSLVIRRVRAHRSGMSDDASNLRIRPGRIRDRGRGARPRAQSFISQVLRAAAKANGGPLTPAQRRGTAPPAMAGAASSMVATPITPTAAALSSVARKTATLSGSSSRPRTAIAWRICAASPETS